MKYVMEFGARGGAHTENFVVPTRKLAEGLAGNLVMVFTKDPRHRAAGKAWAWWPKGCSRLTWRSASHFVAISKLDGVPRGPASAALWRKPLGPELMNEQVIPWEGQA